MLYININIPPKNLSDEHLKREHANIKKIPIYFRKVINSKEKWRKLDQIKKTKENHLYFFLNKPQFTMSRYLKLHTECEKRGFYLKDYREQWGVYGNKKYYEWYKLYKPTKKDKEKAVNRLELDIKTMIDKEFLTYYSSKLTKKGAINKLNK